MTAAAIGMKPMHIRPSAGTRLVVQMRDGKQLDCHATQVISSAGSGIIIYHKRRSIDEMKASGWWPVVKQPAGSGEKNPAEAGLDRGEVT